VHEFLSRGWETQLRSLNWRQLSVPDDSAEASSNSTVFQMPLRPPPQPVTVVTSKEREPGYHYRGIAIAAKICSLLRSLQLSTYDEISPKIEYWIEHALSEQSTDPNDLVERLSSLAWDDNGSETNAAVARFLKDFHDAPHRSEQSRSFVDGLCFRVFWWFTAASAEDLVIFSQDQYRINRVATTGGESFVRVASFIGNLIEQGLLSHELVRRHLVKPLIAHHYTAQSNVQHKYYRATAICQLLVTAGDTLLQGILDSEDVQVCFETLNSEITFGRGEGLDAKKLQARSCATRSGILHRNLTCLIRSSAGSILHGWSRRRRRSEGMPQRLNGVGGKERRVRRSPKSLPKLKLPSLSLPKISP